VQIILKYNMPNLTYWCMTISLVFIFGNYLQTSLQKCCNLTGHHMAAIVNTSLKTAWSSLSLPSP